MTSLHRLLAFMFVLQVAGCSTDSANSVTRGSIAAVFGWGNKPLLSAEELSEFPYAASFVRIGGGPVGLVVLADEKTGSLRWVSGDRIMLVTRFGRVERLLNMSTELLASRSGQMDPLPQMLRLSHAEYQYEIDLMPGYRDRIPMLSQLSRKGLERQKVGYENPELMHVVEELSSDILGFRATNHYWLDPETAEVKKFIQTPAPGIEPIRFEVVVPYAG